MSDKNTVFEVTSSGNIVETYANWAQGGDRYDSYEAAQSAVSGKPMGGSGGNGDGNDSGQRDTHSKYRKDNPQNPFLLGSGGEVNALESAQNADNSLIESKYKDEAMANGMGEGKSADETWKEYAAKQADIVSNDGKIAVNYRSIDDIQKDIADTQSFIDSGLNLNGIQGTNLQQRMADLTAELQETAEHYFLDDDAVADIVKQQETILPTLDKQGRELTAVKTGLQEIQDSATAYQAIVNQYQRMYNNGGKLTPEQIAEYNDAVEMVDKLTEQYTEEYAKYEKVASAYNASYDEYAKTTDALGKHRASADILYGNSKSARDNALLTAAYATDEESGINAANELDAINSDIGKYGSESLRLEREEIANNYRSMQTNDDFNSKVKEGWDTYEAPTQEQLSNGEFHGNIFRALEENPYLSDSRYRYAGYANQKEIDTYSYILATEGEKAANEYYTWLNDALAARAGAETAENVRNIDSGFGRTLAEAGLGLASGIESGTTGIIQNFTDTPLQDSALQYAQQGIMQDINNDNAANGKKFSLEKVVASTANSMGNMLPSIALGAVGGGGLGAAAIGASTRGNTYKQLINEGYTPEQADTVATILGTAEATTSYLVGGVAKLGGKLTGITEEKLMATISNDIAKAATKLGIENLSEISEEVLQNKIESIVRNEYLGENNSLALDENDLETVIVTALTTTLLNGKSTIDTARGKTNVSTGIAEETTPTKAPQEIETNAEPVAPKAEETTPAVTEQPTEIQNILAQETISNKQAEAIIANPLLKAQFEEETGITLTGSKSEQRTQIKNAVEQAQQTTAETTTAPVENTAQNEVSAAQTAEGINTPATAETADTTQNNELNPTAQQTPYEAPTNALLRDRQNPQSELNQPAETETRERGFSENVRTDSAMHPELRQKYENSPLIYEVAKNKTTLNKALDIMEQGLVSAENHIREKLNAAKNDNKKMSPEDVPLARMVANELYSTEGKTEEQIKLDRARADAITSDLAVELTAAGQFGQAAAILRDATPATMLQTIQKAIDEINAMLEKRYGNKKNYTWRAELTEAEVNRINGIDPTNAEEFEKVYKDIAKRLGDEMPATLWEKVTELRRINMLLRPRTMLKNVFANIPTIGIRASDRFVANILGAVATNMENLTEAEMPKQNDDGQWVSFIEKKDDKGKTSKVAVYADTEADCINLAKVTKLGRNEAVFASKKSKEIAAEVTKQMQEQLTDNSGKWDLKGALAEERTIFKKDLFTATGITDKALLEHMRNITYKALELGDKPFVNASFKSALAKYCELHNIKSVEDVPTEAIAYATQQMEYYTYKESKKFAEFINGMKQEGGVAGRAVDILFPFTTTPANIFGMLWDHSVGGAIDTVRYAFDGNKMKTIESFAKTATGSAVVALGYILANMGLISGAADDDKDKAAWDKATGHQAYSIGGRWTYDWAEPAGSLLALGADLQKGIENSEDFWDLLFNGVYSMGDALLDMSMLQNITKILKGNGSPTKNFLETTATSFAGQMGNGLAGNLGAIIDPYNRSYYDSNANLLENTKNNLLYSWGIRGDMAKKVDVKGETETRGNMAQRAVNTLINPGITNYGHMNAVDKTLETVYNATGDKNIFPEVAPTKFDSFGIKGDTILLTPQERADYQQTYSDEYYKRVGELMDTDMFRGMSEEQQRQAILEVKSFCSGVANDALAKARGIEIDSSKSLGLINGVERNGTDLSPIKDENLTTYLAYESMFNKASNSSLEQKDYDTIDNVTAMYDDLPDDVKTAVDERFGNKFSTYLKAYQDYGITSADCGKVFETQEADKAQFDKSSDGTLTKFGGIVNAKVSEATKAGLLEIQLGSNARGLYDAAVAADPNTKVADVYQLWRSMCIREIENPDGTIEYRSRQGSISQFTLYNALESNKFAFADTEDEKAALWESFVNSAPTHQGNGENVEFSVNYEDASKAKVTVDGVEMKLGVDYTVRKGNYGTNIVFKTPPADGADISIDDGTASTKHSYAQYKRNLSRYGTDGYYSRFAGVPDGGYKP